MFIKVKIRFILFWVEIVDNKSICFTSTCIIRLSALAGDRLRLNNPGIADLSDEYRPNKLAEKFSELYDNEWTEFYEDLERTGSTEKQIIGHLLELIQVEKNQIYLTKNLSDHTSFGNKSKTLYICSLEKVQVSFCDHVYYGLYMLV